MTKVFIGGSRRIRTLDADVKERIDRIVEKRLPVVLGDASGADSAVQEYLQSKGYDLVEVFCSGDACRNNKGRWPTRTVQPARARRDFAFYAAKDRVMADEASFGLMVWDKESVGTLMNVFRLLRHHRKIVLYVAPDHQFVDVQSEDDWQRLIAGCSAKLRARIEREATAEESLSEGARSPSQETLF